MAGPEPVQILRSSNSWASAALWCSWVRKGFFMHRWSSYSPFLLWHIYCLSLVFSSQILLFELNFPAGFISFSQDSVDHRPQLDLNPYSPSSRSTPERGFRPKLSILSKRDSERKWCCCIVLFSTVLHSSAPKSVLRPWWPGLLVTRPHYQNKLINFLREMPYSIRNRISGL